MASVEELTKLTRAQLNDFANQNGIDDAADEEKYKTKADLAEALSPVVTPEMLAAFKGEDTPASETPTTEPEVPANVSAPVTPEAPAVDPATQAPESDDEVEGDIEEGDRVSYPYTDAGTDRRVGRVVQLDGQSAYVRYVDGSTRLFGLGSLKLVSKG